MFNIKLDIIVIIIIIYLVFLIPPFVLEYIKLNKFYSNFNSSLNNLDKKYLINEIICKGINTESNYLLESLYQINKCYIEDINKYKYSFNDFKDYLQLWCHEIKTPIATSKLIIENNKNSITESINEEINSIDYYVEQVMYYSKSENVEKDYLINKVSLNDIINSVIKRNKKSIINNKIKINIFNEDILVESDTKWLTYIINQIVTNSIKYISNNPVISFTYIQNKNNIILCIEDNGIGINKRDLNRVFDKGFTGINGRVKTKSTGMGLYLSKKLCIKLGLDIKIESIVNKYTKIYIVFPINTHQRSLTNM